MLADEKKLHVVEFREENDYFPTVVASPATCRTLEEINADEVMDYTQVMQQPVCRFLWRKEFNKMSKVFFVIIIKIVWLNAGLCGNSFHSMH